MEVVLTWLAVFLGAGTKGSFSSGSSGLGAPSLMTLCLRVTVFLGRFDLRVSHLLHSTAFKPVSGAQIPALKLLIDLVPLHLPASA